MKTSFTLLAAAMLLLICSCGNQQKDAGAEQEKTLADTSDLTMDFYDNAETIPLPGLNQIEIDGEVESPVSISFDKLPRRSVIVKETLLKGDSDVFVGAYRYDGYSLYDILNTVKVVKKNEKEFHPIIDLYVEITGKDGSKAIFSWGEIFYPIHRHEIIIATDVMRIVPSKTKDLWPLPVQRKMVAAHDLITERNISEPVKITIRSYPASFKVNKGADTAYSPSFTLYNKGEKLGEISKITGLNEATYPAIFYGKGRGIHSTQPFKGYIIREWLSSYLGIDQVSLRTGMVLAVAEDGYRAVFTLSEIMNRNDQAELLLIYRPEDKKYGVFRLYPAADFFSDRAVKALKAIYITTE